MKNTNKKKIFFAYDDTKILPIILIVLTVLTLIVLVKCSSEVYVVIFSLLVICLELFGIVLFLLSGIHCNVGKKTFIIVDSLIFRKIKFENIQYVTFKRIEKKRKKCLFPLSNERTAWFSDPYYVYNNGEVFVVEFHLKNGTTETTYYTWLFKAKSKKRVERQKLKLEQFISTLDSILYPKQK